MIALRVESEAELERCLEIRRRVFIEEQGVAQNLELDGLEDECAHFLAWKGDDHDPAFAVGTARLWTDENGRAKAQRVAVFAEARGLGIGRQLMAAVEREARARGNDELFLGAQIEALSFYEEIGYRAYGEPFDDAGIPHRMMKRALNRPRN